MKTIGVIPSRWASTRFPGKSLARVCGIPLVIRVLENARKARRLDEVIVATDDERIMNVVREAGGQCVMTREDHPSGTDRIVEAIKGICADIVINIQGDEPFIDPGLIDSISEALEKNERWDMCTAACPFEKEEDLINSSIVKVVKTVDSRALYFSRSAIPFVRDKAPEGFSYWRHIGIYGYRRAFLESFVAEGQSMLEKAEKLEQLRALEMGGNMLVLETVNAGIGVDTPEDIGEAEHAVRRHHPDKGE